MSQPSDKRSSKLSSLGRRDFLLGRSFFRHCESPTASRADSANPANPPVGSKNLPRWKDQDNPLSTGQQTAYWQTYSKRAMACQFEILLNFGQYAWAAATIEQAFQLVDQLEAQLTVYRDDSEVSLINRIASQTGVSIETGLFDLLQVAVEIHQQTNGAFDITADPLSHIWGFKQRQFNFPDPAAIEAARKQVGSDKIILDSDLRTVQFTQDRLAINLGAIGKGYAIDRVATLMRRHGLADFVVHGGQSSALAIGSDSAHSNTPREQVPSFPPVDKPSISADITSNNMANNVSNDGWRIGLSHPVLPNRKLCDINLRDSAMATSGTARQGFYHQGKRYGHIIDPRTGWPADNFLSTTVICSSAARADALATAFHCMSLDEVSQFCAIHPKVKVILVNYSKASTTGQVSEAEENAEMDIHNLPGNDPFGLFRLRTFNLDADDLIPLD